MSRVLAMLALVCCMGPASAQQSQEFSGLARLVPDQSQVVGAGRAGVRINLGLTQGVPFRIFTLAEPPRLVLDFQEVDWGSLKPADLLQTDKVTQVQFGSYVPGWSRMVAELAQPMGVDQAEMQVSPETGAAQLNVILAPVSAEEFAARAGAPQDPRWDLPAPEVFSGPKQRGPDAPLRVVLDPGHGGIDPGAETDRIDEKVLMLTFARELREQLLRSGRFEVVLTRDEDRFVSLEGRIALAHQVGADVFISLHADSLSEGQAHGATVHVLSRDASDVASAKLAERHDRGQLLSGVDLSEADDQVTGILLDLARQETQPRTNALAQALVSGMAQTGGPMNRRPLRSAGFSVLKAADIPSVLIEIGFMSSPRDLKNLQNPEWRAQMARGIRNGLIEWRASDEAQRPLVRQ